MCGEDQRLRVQATICPQFRAIRRALGRNQGYWWPSHRILDSDMQTPVRHAQFVARAGAVRLRLRNASPVDGKGDDWVRIASSRIANWVRNKLSGEEISDAGCTYRAFKQECVADLKFSRGCTDFCRR